MSVELMFADPHPVMLDGLDSVFRHEAGFSVCSSVQDGEAAWHAIQRLRPHIVIHELDLPKRDGLSLIRAIRSDGLHTIPVVFTSAARQHIADAKELGVLGLIGKDKPRETLLECVRSVLRGQPWLDAHLPGEPQDAVVSQSSLSVNHSVLTAREWSVAKLVVEGLPNKRIAHRLNISEGTAKLHLHHIYQKLQCPGRMALLLYMKDHHLG